MTLLARRRDTGDTVEVLALTLDDLVLIAPPGHPSQATLVPGHLLDPDPLEVSLFEGFHGWTDRSLAHADA